MPGIISTPGTQALRRDFVNHEHSHISRRAGTVGFYTFLSRILGLVRDMTLAWFFGATKIGDAFFVAFRIPNLLRRLVAEGSLTIAFVPVYTEYLKKSREEGRRAASVVFTYLALLLAVIMVLGIAFAPWIVRLIAWGFQASPDQFDLTVYLTRIMFPYIFFISMVALAMGILNSLKRFAAPAAAPIFLNLAIIFGALVLWRFFEMPTVGLAVGVLIGGALQLALQIPSLVKEGMLPRISFRWRHPALKGVLLLMIPSAFGAAVYQLNVLVVTLLASFLPEGSVSYLWYADRISEFPLGIFAIAVATATLPTLSDHAAEKNHGALKETLNFGLRLSFLIAIPAAAGLYLLAKPVVTVLFQRGEFTHTASIATAGALAFFAIKIPFVSGVRNLVPGFFALKDAKTPVAVSIIAVIANLIFALILMRTMQHVGLALALAISSAFNFVLLLWLFRRKVGPIGGRRLAFSILKTCLASAAMGIVLIAVTRALNPFALETLWARAGALILLVAGGAAIFIAMTRVINAEEYQALMGLMRRKERTGELPGNYQS